MKNVPPIAFASSMWFGFSVAFRSPIPRFRVDSCGGRIGSETATGALPDPGVDRRDEINSLSDLAKDCALRADSSPTEATPEDDVYAGNDSLGYRAIRYGDLAMDPRGGERHNITMHVMDAFVSHGVLLVDLTSFGGDAKIMAEPWKAPAEARDVTGGEGSAETLSAFDVVADVARRVVRVAIAVSSLEYGAFEAFETFEGDDDDDDDDEPKSARLERASDAAALLCVELVDDGRPLKPTSRNRDEGSAGTIPHELSQYEWNREGRETTAAAQGMFDARTDSSFVVVAPAAGRGLEVFDEAMDLWYSPEPRARAIWEEERRSLGEDPTLGGETLEDGAEVPWHARYLALVPGELLRIATRGGVPAAVHRAAATREGPPGLGSMTAIGGRPGARFRADRYLGGTMGCPLLEECDGMTTEEICKALRADSIN